MLFSHCLHLAFHAVCDRLASCHRRVSMARTSYPLCASLLCILGRCSVAPRGLESPISSDWAWAINTFVHLVRARRLRAYPVSLFGTWNLCLMEPLFESIGTWNLCLNLEPLFELRATIVLSVRCCRDNKSMPPFDFGAEIALQD